MSLLKLKQKFISFVFQPTCCFCDSQIQQFENELTPSESSQIVCDRCYEQTLGCGLDRCYFCGTETNPLNPFGSRCSACRHWNSKFERVIAIGKYRDHLRTSILNIKRESNDTKAFQIGMLLGHLFDKRESPQDFDAVVPVPSHWRRRLSRKGFHVTDTMAQGFSRSTKLRVKNILKCTKYTGKQSKLRPNQRIRNVRGAFKIAPKIDLSNLRIVLLDDVMTSGATINECTKMLLKGGVQSVFVAVAARGTGIS